MTELPPDEQIQRILAGKWIIPAMRAAVELGIPEALEVPQSAAALASTLECPAELLMRLLGVLSGEGLVFENEHGVFSLTRLGRELRRDHLGELVRFVGAPIHWNPWSRLADAVRSGTPAFELAFGTSLFDHMRNHPDDAALYDAAVDRFTERQARGLAESDVLTGDETVVDVGGGRGTLLYWLLTLKPGLRGVLFDRPDVVDRVRPRFVGLEDRCELVGGDFFEPLPTGSDVYVVKHVVHNWGDPEATAILSRCRDAAGPDGRVLVVEGFLLPSNMRDKTRLLDLEMMAITGSGRERSKPEYRRLLRGAGLRLVRTVPLDGGAWVMVATHR